MTLPTDYVDGDVLTAADVNAITTAVNGISSKVVNYAYVQTDTQYSTNSTNNTNSGVSLSYTPINASNKLIVEASFYYGLSGTNINRNSRIGSMIIRNTTSSTNVVGGNRNYSMETASDDPTDLYWYVTLRGVVDAGSTSARTYAIQYAVADAAYSAIIGATGAHTVLSVMEVTP